MMFTRNKILTKIMKYVINQALNAPFKGRSMVCLFAHYTIYIYTSKYCTYSCKNFQIERGASYCCFFLLNGLIIIIIKVLFVGHIFLSGIFVYFKFIEYPYISFLWFLIWVTFFPIYHVYVIVSKGYLRWLFL